MTVVIPIALISLAVISFGMAIRTVRSTFSTEKEVESVDDPTVLMIKVPKQNEQNALSAEMFFAAVHGLLQEEEDIGVFSFEMMANSQGIFFYAVVPSKFQKFIENQIYAQYPTAEIAVGEDYSKSDIEKDSVIRATELVLTKEYFYPIKTFPDFEVDPLAAITSAVETLSEHEKTWFQMIIKPIDEGWQEPGYEKIVELKTGKVRDRTPIWEFITGKLLEKSIRFVFDILAGLLMNPSTYMEDRLDDAADGEKYEMSEEAKAEVESIRTKLALLGFEVSMRIVGIGKSEQEAQHNVGSMVAAFKQFSSGQLNSLKRSAFLKDPDQILSAYRSRVQPKEKDSIYILNTEELASIYHLPNDSVATPNIDYIMSKKGEPPLNLPINTDMKFAFTTFRNRQVEFGIHPKDRRRHMYLIGKTGSGKSTLMQNMIIQDIRHGEGFCLIDPHGDLFSRTLDFIPENRIDDVVIFDPSDIDYPVALNMFEILDPDQKTLVASGLVEVFRKRFEFSWGPRMEHFLRNIFLTLVDIPHCTFLGVTRIITDRSYRRYIVNLIEDPILRDFWNNEFEAMITNDRVASEAVGPIQNRLGPFLSTPTIRNIVGQATGTVDLPKIMNEGKIFLVNLSKGLIGEDNSAILGSFLVSRLWFSAMTRAGIPEDERRDFHVYVDEFQNFATSTFSTILSESRKYRLNLVMAHQYMAQLDSEGSSSVRDAVFGNVGTIMSYIVGEEDAEILAKAYEPYFEPNDILNLGKFQLYLKLMIADETSRPFSAGALPPLDGPENLRDEVIARSRARYARPRAKVEDAINEWTKKTYAPGIDDEQYQKDVAERKRRFKELQESFSELKT